MIDIKLEEVNNDITANIWHRDRGSMTYREEQFDNLHRVIAEVI